MSDTGCTPEQDLRDALERERAQWRTLQDERDRFLVGVRTPKCAAETDAALERLVAGRDEWRRAAESLRGEVERLTDAARG